MCAGNRVDDNRASAHIGRQRREKIMVGSAIVMVGLAIVDHGSFILFLCEMAVHSRRILGNYCRAQDSVLRRGVYRPIDVLTLSGVEQERRAVAERAVVDFWGGITVSFPSFFCHSCSVDQTHIPHTNTAHQKIKKMFEQEIEVNDINASDSEGRSCRPTTPA